MWITTMVDAHCHIQFPAYDLDRDAVIGRARKAGVSMIAVGTQHATSQDAVALAREYPGEVWATAGFHPGHVAADWYFDKNEQRAAEQERFDSKALRALARDPNVVAVGECGLDYYRNKTEEVRRKQTEVFQEQVELAHELKKPLMIHCRPSKGTDDAYEDLLDFKSQMSNLKCVVHFYVGSPSVTEKLIDAGFYVTFGGVITFARDYDETIRMIPLNRIMLETDAPYAAPAPYRGGRNESAFVIEVARHLARIQGISFERVTRETTENAYRLFPALRV